MKRLLFILLLVGTISYGQFKQYMKSDGLSDNTVYHVFQDSSKLLWLLTESGVSTYNGQKFSNYFVQDGLGSNENFEIRINENEDLVFLGANGKPSYFENDTFKTDRNICFSNFISEYTYVYREKEVFSSFGGGICIKSNGRIHSIDAQNGLNNDFVSHLWSWDRDVYFIDKTGIGQIDRNNNISYPALFPNHEIYYARAFATDEFCFFASDSSFYKYVRGGSLYPLKKDKELDDIAVTAVQKVADEWFVCAYQGLFQIEFFGDSVGVNDHLLKNKIVTSVCLDHENNYWASTLNEGLFSWKKNELKMLNGEECFGLHYYEDKLYTGLHNSRYAVRENGELKFVQLESKNQYSSQKIRAITHYNDLLWFEMDGGIANWDLKEIKYYRTSVGTILFKDSMIFLGNKYGLYKVSFNDFEKTLFQKNSQTALDDVAEPITFEPVRKLCEGNGTIYIGTSNELMFYVGDEIFKTEFYDQVTHLSFVNNWLLIGLRNKGTWISDGDKNFNLENYIELPKSGLTSGLMSEHYLMLGFRTGLYQINTETKAVEMILNNYEINDVVIGNDTLFISTDQGLFCNPFPINETPALSIPITSSNLKVNDIEMSEEEIQNLAYYENNIDVSFEFIYFGDAKNKSLFRLNKGPWNECNQKVTLRELSPGDYNLEIKSEAGKHSSEVVHYKFTINVPWWKSWWFRLTIVFASVLLIYWFFKVRILTYNKDIVRELLILITAKFKKEKFILIKDIRDGSLTKIKINELHCVESSKNYVTFHCVAKKITARMTLKNALELLSERHEGFEQVHRSWLINTTKIEAVHGEFIKTTKMKVPIGQSYLDSAKEKFALLNKS